MQNAIACFFEWRPYIVAIIINIPGEKILRFRTMRGSRVFLRGKATATAAAAVAAGALEMKRK